MKPIYIEKNEKGYLVTSFPDKDGAPAYHQYDNADDLTNILPIVSKDLTGLAKDSDRVIVYFNEDGSVEKTDAQIVSSSKSEGLSISLKKSDDIPVEIKDAVSGLKTEILTKPPL